MTHPKMESGRVNDWPEQGVCSSPAVSAADKRVYYVSSRAEVIALDTEGFRDGKNDGPYTEETETSEIDGDIIWKVDMYTDLGVFPHNMAATSPLIIGDILFVNTSNGVDESHVNIPSPRSPSFLAINRHTGEILWEDGSPGDKILHGQWSSPAYGVMGGKAQVIFAGGDGWLRSFEPETGKLIWQFDCNPKESEWKQGRGDRNNIIATPVIFDNKVFVAVGQDPEHGEGVGHLWAVDGTKQGDVTESGLVWHHPFRRTISSVAIDDGVVYAANFSGFLHALEKERQTAMGA
jgi:outer membrane protein assembly factor BamB